GSPPRPARASGRERCAARPCGRRGRRRRARLVLAREGGFLAGGLLQRHRRGRALALPLLLVDLLAEEIELDGHVVGILEEDLEERRACVGKAAEVHLDLVLLDAASHPARVLREEGDVVDLARSGRARGVFLEEKLIA